MNVLYPSIWQDADGGKRDAVSDEKEITENELIRASLPRKMARRRAKLKWKREKCELAWQEGQVRDVEACKTTYTLDIVSGNNSSIVIKSKKHAMQDKTASEEASSGLENVL